MNRYQLAKLVEWAGTLKSRKRMQKIVFMLQAAGCPLEADFFLHRYGPYSTDVARLTDELVVLGWLDEGTQGIPNGVLTYDYTLTDRGSEILRKLERDKSQDRREAQISQFKPLVERLRDEPLRTLEVASTIAYFRRCGNDWSTAVRKAFEFKEVEAGSDAARKMEELAREVVT